MRNPQFVVGGYQRCDMDQGYVGNCWFIAGCVGIMQSEKCFNKVVQQDQNFDDYAGKFKTNASNIFNLKKYLFVKEFFISVSGCMV